MNGALKVGVSGATGMVGRSVVSTLAQAGHSVLALARAPQPALFQGLPAVSFAAADLTTVDPLELQSLCKGLDVLVHAAGFVDPLAGREEVFAVNLGGTRKIFEAATAAGVRQFIHISSLSVITGQEDQFDLDESAPLRRCGEAYADSKVESEEFISKQNGPMVWTILRPGFIYGEGERSWLPRVIASIRGGQAVLVDGGKRQTNVVYAGNLSRAVMLCLLNEKSYGQVFNITDGEPVTKKQLFDAVADACGSPRIKKDLPRWLLQPVCTLVTAFARGASAPVRAGLARFSPAAFRLVAVNQGFSIKKAQTLLGYPDKQCLPFAEAMQLTLKSFK